MKKVLNVFYENILVGKLTEDSDERLSFQYSKEWIEKDLFPLSINLKIQPQAYGHLDTKSFFENLLPEGEVRDHIEASVHGSVKDEFNFLKQFGADCAGALIITPEDSPHQYESSDRKELQLDKLYSYLEKKVSLAQAIVNEEGGRFSLAGAQDKIPVIYNDKKIFISTGGEATTHILKPLSTYSSQTKDSPFNEYFCMKLAKEVGLNVPFVDIIEGEFPLYIVKRYDRIETQKGIQRIHQQDFCQALGVTSKKKYEIDGGPSLADNYKLILSESSQAIKDLDQFLKWFWFNLFVGNNDSHSKNISFIYEESKIILAPFYDIVATSVYDGISDRFSFIIGGQDKWYDLKITNFEKQAKDLDMTYAKLIKVGTALGKKMMKKVGKLKSKCEKKYPNQYIFTKLEQEISKRIKHFQIHVFENSNRK